MLNKEVIFRFSGKYDFLSNFYPCLVEYEGIVYPSAEHAFQAAKVTDEETRKKFSLFPTAADAKYFGRRVPLRKDWETVKDSIMLKILESKFTKVQLNGETLTGKLLDTKDLYLEEGNSHGDKYWGTVKGEGKNMLGNLLMQVRQKLQEGTLK